MSPAKKTAEPMGMPFRKWSRVGLEPCVRTGSGSPRVKGNFEGEEGPAQDMTFYMSGGPYTQSNSTEGKTGTVRTPIGVY